LASEAKWVRDGDYQLADCYAQEIEEVLRFLDGNGQLGRFRSRLSDDLRARDAALAEGRAGRVLVQLGCHILRWEPPSLTGKPGDLEVEWPGAPPIFVEVKGPDWQSELSTAELRSPRKAQGKWVDLEARAVSPTASPLDVTQRNALKKFSRTRANLVAIVDDLFVSPAQARGVIEGSIREFFLKPEVGVLGGILFVTPDYIAGQIRYFINFYENPLASQPCQLPATLVRNLVEISELQRADRSARMSSPLTGSLEEPPNSRIILP
jgi:hypothetical protein